MVKLEGDFSEANLNTAYTLKDEKEKINRKRRKNARYKYSDGTEETGDVKNS